MSLNKFDGESLGYADQWLEMRNTRPHDLYSIPDSPVASLDEDCDYDEDQSCVDGRSAQINNGNQDAVTREYGASETHCGNGSAQDAPPELYEMFGTIYTELSNQVEALKTQFYNQNGWNENMQQGMETVAQRSDEIPAIQEVLATLQAENTAMREAIAMLQGNKAKDSTIERKPGRSKRLL
ncbi:hypothetical protein ACN42_g9771 [Penicillium freii]|uniref:Uncharacterized protein n=1 Tax=Penicillium freii TaxID=48697 RepID=A0A101MBA3_PENFR|nr:hypothetical protein ACN42_g9771 [Penicillium freii]